ncbi:MAG: glycosyltransferase family 2 protein [Segetibacter sp.]
MTEEKPPLITIITVVYNGEATLKDTIESVISINYKNINYIIIDGGSKDGTVDVIKNYASYIKYWVSERDKGIYDAMNKGWKMADKNSYILFLGTGDRVLSLPQNLKDDYSKVFYGDVVIGNKLFKPTHNKLRLTLGNTLHHQALLIPKTLNEEPPFGIGYKIYGDFDFNQRLLKEKVKFEYRKDFKSYALPGGISADKLNDEMLGIVKKNFGIVATVIAFCYYSLQKFKQHLQKL